MDYEKLNLSDNPFASTPTAERPVWCGMSTLKAQLERRLEVSLKTSPTSLILNWGHYGSGKTHAAKYFTSDETLTQLAQIWGMRAPLAFYINFPRVDRGAVFNLTSSIIGKFGVENFAAKLKEVKTVVDQADAALFEQLIRDYCADSELQKIFLTLVANEPASYDAISRILFGNGSQADLRELEIARKPDSISDLCRIVTTAFNLFTFRSSQIQPLHSAIHLWIDEFEDISSLPGKEQDALAAYLRNLVDWCPRYLTIFLNFTLTPVQGLQDLGVYLGDAVSSRIRQRIEFSEPEKPEIKAYIREMLNAPDVRLNSSEAGPFLPFENSAIELIVDAVSPRTPRRINEVCSFYLDLAAGSEAVTTVSEALIREYAGDIGLEV
jgi:hypothetical protein